MTKEDTLHEQKLYVITHLGKKILPALHHQPVQS